MGGNVPARGAAPRDVWFWAEAAFYAANLIIFYGFIIIPVGTRIRSQCIEIRGVPVYPADLSDGQWREFRGSLPLLCAAMAGSLVLRCLHGWLQRRGGRGGRGQLDLAYGIALLVLQHGWHSAIVLVLLAISYSAGWLTKGTRYRIGASWAVGIGTILLKESYRIKRHFTVVKPLFDRSYGGMYGWNLPANFLVLRMVSFACDEHWAGEAAKESKKSDHEVWALTGAAAGANDEPQGHRPLAEYNLIHFAAYCLYPPLYMAGPIMTFNSYAFYTKKSSGGPGVLLYAIRWLLCLAVLEGGLCFFPMFAVVSCGLFWDLSPIEMAVAAYVLLKLMWLKFLLLWRFFRLWALVDGKEPPENMTRCMSNNCSLEQFWRGWHSSFNKWLVQYMYVPMGGRNNRIISVWIIFIFVAVWHDIEPKLLAWGILNAMFYLFEVMGKKIYYSQAVQKSGVPTSILYGVSVLSSSTYICVLIAINMIGYAIGLGGAADTLNSLTIEGRTKEIALFICGTYYFLSIGVCLMRFLSKNGYSQDC